MVWECCRLLRYLLPLFQLFRAEQVYPYTNSVIIHSSTKHMGRWTSHGHDIDYNMTKVGGIVCTWGFFEGDDVTDLDWLSAYYCVPSSQILGSTILQFNWYHRVYGSVTKMSQNSSCLGHSEDCGACFLESKKLVYHGELVFSIKRTVEFNSVDHVKVEWRYWMNTRIHISCNCVWGDQLQ